MILTTRNMVDHLFAVNLGQNYVAQLSDCLGYYSL